MDEPDFLELKSEWSGCRTGSVRLWIETKTTPLSCETWVIKKGKAVVDLLCFTVTHVPRNSCKVLSCSARIAIFFLFFASGWQVVFFLSLTHISSLSVQIWRRPTSRRLSALSFGLTYTWVKRKYHSHTHTHTQKYKDGGHYDKMKGHTVLQSHAEISAKRKTDLWAAVFIYHTYSCCQPSSLSWQRFVLAAACVREGRGLPFVALHTGSMSAEHLCVLRPVSAWHLWSAMLSASGDER